MLKDAALFQLELVDRALQEGMDLRDASPYNVQWKGVREVFIDVPSFARRREGEPWVGYRQFCRMFLFPLLLQARRGQPSQPLLRSRPRRPVRRGETSALFSAWNALSPGVLVDVFLQAWFEKRHAGDRGRARQEIAQAGFRPEFIRRNVRRLRKIVEGLCWELPRSPWSSYARERSYSPEDASRKGAFVEAAVGRRPRKLVWDLGCNAGGVLPHRGPERGTGPRPGRRRLGGQRALPRPPLRGPGLPRPAPRHGRRGPVPGPGVARAGAGVLGGARTPGLGAGPRPRAPPVPDGSPPLGGDRGLVPFPRRRPRGGVRRQGRPHGAAPPPKQGGHLRRLQREFFEGELEKVFEIKERLDLTGGTRRLYHAVPR